MTTTSRSEPGSSESSLDIQALPVLAVLALLIGIESAVRLATPISIRFNEAIAVAALGLIVNLVSA